MSIIKRATRLVYCTACSLAAGHGTTQVYRKIVFHFCRQCWTHGRSRCHKLMETT